LAEALRASARGLCCAEAAVGLLIGHLVWLLRADFVGCCIAIDQSFVEGTPIALVDWAEAVAALETGRLPCSSSEGRVLRIAAGLAEGIPLDVREAVSGLDAANIVLVVRAILHAAGHRDCDVALGRTDSR
jgi:hypothetical protein